MGAIHPGCTIALLNAPFRSSMPYPFLRLAAPFCRGLAFVLRRRAGAPAAVLLVVAIRPGGYAAKGTVDLPARIYRRAPPLRVVNASISGERPPAVVRLRRLAQHSGGRRIELGGNGCRAAAAWKAAKEISTEAPR
jgi:hypothetical protein